MYKGMQLKFRVYVERDLLLGPTIDDQTPDEIMRRLRWALSGYRNVMVDLDPEVVITVEKL